MLNVSGKKLVYYVSGWNSDNTFSGNGFLLAFCTKHVTETIEHSVTQSKHMQNIGLKQRFAEIAVWQHIEMHCQNTHPHDQLNHDQTKTS